MKQNKQPSEVLLTNEQALSVLKRINRLYPNAKGELKWDSVFHLLCAVSMSARTTDKMVNRVTPKFNRDFPEPEDLAQASLTAIESDIASIGFYHAKAKHLKAMASLLIDRYDGHIPKDKAALMTLPGVGEKTANVVLAEAYQIPAIAVDTHVSRISKAFHLVPNDASPHEIEKRLESILPKKDWIATHHAMIFFGRYTMKARNKDKDPYSFLPPE